ncbi:QWRF motif-containing protein 7 [Cinnamomum micranthum f. kanehirae]|uniref:QWRF motif-containing protein 7 n=1 Tax=Cinnamomum micranthum f. kanehirae TaxID=337451 RepID=A0A3S3PFY2_9MAGN|nr:QWRF motif-containing protein 7 [Cinnamomum micranthum f. kanehirae]
MDNSRQTFTSGLSRSPRLQRSRSGASCTFAPETQPFSCNSYSYHRISINRSKSTSKTRTITNTNTNTNTNTKKVKDKDEENRNPKSQDKDYFPQLLPSSKKPQEMNRENLAAIFHRHGIADDVSKAAEAAKLKAKAKAKKERLDTSSPSPSPSPSPSAWALSPGRSPTPAMEQYGFGGASKNKKKEGGSGVSNVLSYFRQKKKMPSAREETFHHLRILQTRLLQWRFINARAEATMAAGKSTAQKKLFNVWLETFRLRNSVIEKRIQVQKLKAEIKLRGILSSQIHLLNEWERLDKRNLEAVTKSAKIFRAACLNVPLVGGAKANIYSVYRAFCTAMDVMNGMEDTISRFFFQVGRMSSLLTELVMVVKQESESLEKLMETTIMTASLEAQERNLRVHLIQAMTDREPISFPSMVIWS